MSGEGKVEDGEEGEGKDEESEEELVVRVNCKVEDGEEDEDEGKR